MAFAEIASAQTGSDTSASDLRGVGNFVTTPIRDSAVATNYDGVYAGRTASGFAFFDLQRVEVLKGPQGTLYGRNATGGAINIIPQRPKAGEFGGYGSISYGNYSDLQLESAFNIPLGDKGAFRASGYVRDRDGYLKDGTNDDKSAALRLQMMAELTPALTIRVAGDYSHLGGHGNGTSYLGRYQAGPGGYAFIPSGLPISEGMFTPAAQAFRQQIFIAPSGRLDAPVTGYPRRNNNFYGANAELTYDTGAGTLTFTPPGIRAYRSGELLRQLSDTQYKSKQYREFSYRPEVLADGFWRSNAQINLEPRDGGWSLAAFVQNIENKRAPTWMVIGPLTNTVVTSPGRPRTYGARLSFQF